MEKCQSNTSAPSGHHGMVFYSRRSRRCWPCCCGIVQCRRMLWYCIKCFCDSGVQVSFKNLYQVNSWRSVLQFSYLFRTLEIKRTGHCKIQDLSVRQKEVWGKLVKCHIEEGESEDRICNIKLFGQGIYGLLSQREHMEGRKERSKKWLFWEDQRVRGSMLFTVQEGRGGASVSAGQHPDIVWTKNKQTSSLLPISRSLKIELGKWSSELVK